MIADRPQRWLATCPRSLPPLLAQELADLGATELRELPSGVEFTGSRAILYRACLWSRLANRVLLPVGEGAAQEADELYATLRAIPWETLIAASSAFVVEFHGTSGAIRNTRFGAQRSKDAIVDRFRDSGLQPPQARPEAPEARVVVRLHRGRVDVALDMVGESLHRRGYRRAAGEAPLKENLAAALLLRAGWPAAAERGEALIDPMCGSATLLIEGALMAADVAPALGRERFFFEVWPGHDEAQWRALVSDASSRARRGLQRELPEIRGYDADPRVIGRAQENIAAAGLKQHVRVSVKSLGEVRKPTHRSLPGGLVISNPPYGERLGRRESLPQLYRRLGELLHQEFAGWQAAILVADRDLGHELGLRSYRQYAFFNGRLAVFLLLIDLRDNRLRDAADARLSADTQGAGTAQIGEGELSAGARMFANRLAKNQKRLDAWLRSSGYDCYRLYDADMPEYAVAVDRYGDWLHVAEYRAPAKVDEQAAERRLMEVSAALPVATGVSDERIVFKRRERQRGRSQYQRQGKSEDFLSVREGAARLLVNLHDYLDTGLFLDHRPLRRRIAAEVKGKRFLNLFCYTGSATVQAALGGARSTTSVDLSNTYLRWLARNLAHNGLAETHNRLVRADVTAWLAQADDCFDLILLDPPSFSNSSSFEGSFDVQRDHAQLVARCMARLEPQGRLYFSNNRRKFRLDPGLADRYHCEDITSATLDPDFARRRAPHCCFLIRHKDH